MELNKIKNMDCLEYLNSLPDNSVDLVVTDPPYNVSQNKNVVCNDLKVTKNFGDWDFGFNPAPVLAEIKRVLKPKGQIFVFCSTKQIPEYMAIFKDKWFFRNLLVWNKTNPAPRVSKLNFVFANEYILYAINDPTMKPGQVTFNWQGHKEMHNILTTPTLQGRERLRDENNKATHPTQKPLNILKKLISIGSNEGDVVLDCFMGVGSTAIACKELNRNFIGCELDKKYCKKGNERLQSS